VQNHLEAGRLEYILPLVCGPQLDIHAVYFGQRRVALRTRAFLSFVAANISTT
jgi:hypothetical protein